MSKKKNMAPRPPSLAKPTIAFIGFKREDIPVSTTGEYQTFTDFAFFEFPIDQTMEHRQADMKSLEGLENCTAVIISGDNRKIFPFIKNAVGSVVTRKQIPNFSVDTTLEEITSRLEKLKKHLAKDGYSDEKETINLLVQERVKENSARADKQDTNQKLVLRICSELKLIFPNNKYPVSLISAKTVNAIVCEAKKTAVDRKSVV